MDIVGHDRSMIHKSMSDCLIHLMYHPVLLLWLFIWYKSGKIELFDYLSTSVSAEGQKALLLKSICESFKFCLVFFLQLLFINQDLIVSRDLCLLWHLDVLCPTMRAKKCVDARWSHTKPRSPVRQARTALDLNQGVPVNLTCILTRKQQTVKFKRVSAEFPNHSYAGYWQSPADIEDDKRSGMMSV